MPEEKLKKEGKYECACGRKFFNPQAMKMHQKTCEAFIKTQAGGAASVPVTIYGGDSRVIEDLGFGDNEVRGQRLNLPQTQPQVQPQARAQEQPRGFASPLNSPSSAPQGLLGGKELIVCALLLVVALVAGALYLSANNDLSAANSDKVAAQSALASSQLNLQSANAQVGSLQSQASSCASSAAGSAAQLSLVQGELSNAQSNLSSKSDALTSCLTNAASLNGVIALKDLNQTNYLQIEDLRQQLLFANYSLQLALLNETGCLNESVNANYSALGLNFAKNYCPKVFGWTCNSNSTIYFNVTSDNVTCYSVLTENVTGSFTC